MAKRPNIIFMMTDDQRYDTFGFMSDGAVITPHLDQMASEGVRFNNAYHVSPICMPSRASVHMGKYICDHKSGFDTPTDYTVSEAEFDNSYPVHLRNKGYRTGFIGKFGYAVTKEKIKNAKKVLGERLYPDAYKRVDSQEHLETSMPKAQFDVWNGFIAQGDYYEKDGLFNGFDNPYGATHLNDFMGCQAVEFIKDSNALGQPFNLSLSFKAPHAPWTPEEKYRRMYDDQRIPRQYNDTPEHFALLPEVVRTKSRNPHYYHNTGEWKHFGAGSWAIEENYQEDQKNYYALITGVDAVVGRIRETLKELGIEGETILIYTSDNGLFCGSKQIGGKSILYEESIKAPMIVYDPRLGDERKNISVDGLISHVDIAPTIMDMAGIDPQACGFRGVSFKTLVDGTEDEIHDYVFGENNYNDNYLAMSEVANSESYQSTRSKYVRDKQFKYIKYHECHPVVEELYDVINDPYEVHNLVGNKVYEEVYTKLVGQLNRFVNEVVVMKA